MTYFTGTSPGSRTTLQWDVESVAPASTRSQTDHPGGSDAQDHGRTVRLARRRGRSSRRLAFPVPHRGVAAADRSEAPAGRRGTARPADIRRVHPGMAPAEH